MAKRTIGNPSGEPPVPKPTGPRVKGSTAPTAKARPKTKTKTKTVSAKSKALAAKGKPYKGQSSKKAVRKTTKKVTARSGKTGKSATKQARRMVRARKATNKK